ncbi:hypothetical protein Salat_2614700 [Sesamum alatum]|uniref:Uncharacterized protein n=1 Tax=Sesamum alatum TaxID=300844 RepID=A0AAE1XNE9_9LAMI|nr:hypothetical protein Salat_2614700 [Sesamum alatum]
MTSNGFATKRSKGNGGFQISPIKGKTIAPRAGDVASSIIHVAPTQSVPSRPDLDTRVKIYFRSRPIEIPGREHIDKYTLEIRLYIHHSKRRSERDEKPGCNIREIPARECREMRRAPVSNPQFSGGRAKKPLTSGRNCHRKHVEDG